MTGANHHGVLTDDAARALCDCAENDGMTLHDVRCDHAQVRAVETAVLARLKARRGDRPEIGQCEALNVGHLTFKNERIRCSFSASERHRSDILVCWRHATAFRVERWE